MAAIDRLAWWYGTALCLCFASTSFYVLVGFFRFYIPKLCASTRPKKSLDIFGLLVMK